MEPIRNLFAALFLSSIGMLIHVQFLWAHVDILLASVILVIVVKTTFSAVVTKAFGYSTRTSFLVSWSLFYLSLQICFMVGNCLSALHWQIFLLAFLTNLFWFVTFCYVKVGVLLAQVGEFAFVLLSRASNLHLVEVISLLRWSCLNGVIGSCLNFNTQENECIHLTLCS